jgi:hypothetical protein
MNAASVITKKLSTAEQQQLANADPDGYDTYLVRRVVEIDAMPDAQRKAASGDYLMDRFVFGLRFNTSDPERAARLELLLIMERARLQCRLGGGEITAQLPPLVPKDE